MIHPSPLGPRLPSPAPWRMDYVPDRFVSGVELPRCVISDANGVTLFLSNHDLPGDLQLANTRLACQAPRLAWALRQLLDEIDAWAATGRRPTAERVAEARAVHRLASGEGLE